MNIFGIGLPEMAVIAAIGLLVFGPKRLPELGKTLGRTLRGFQTASQEFEQEFRSAVGAEGEPPVAPAPPVEAIAAAPDAPGSIAATPAAAIPVAAISVAAIPAEAIPAAVGTAQAGPAASRPDDGSMA
jgi:sec-independent protein translocase protein TatA